MSKETKAKLLGKVYPETFARIPVLRFPGSDVPDADGFYAGQMFDMKTGEVTDRWAVWHKDHTLFKEYPDQKTAEAKAKEFNELDVTAWACDPLSHGKSCCHVIKLDFHQGDGRKILRLMEGCPPDTLQEPRELTYEPLEDE